MCAKGEEQELANNRLILDVVVEECGGVDRKSAGSVHGCPNRVAVTHAVILEEHLYVSYLVHWEDPVCKVAFELDA